MKEYKIGIIGYGFMGKTHAYGYKTLPLYYNDLPFRIRLAGVCTSSEQSALKAKENMDFDFCTTDPDQILCSKDIDIVNICTPNIYHKDEVIKAIKNGKHIYCEKPLAVNAEETEEILDSLKGTHCVNQIVFNNRFLPAIMRAKELVDEGRLGRMLVFRAKYLHSGSVDPLRPIGWKQDEKYGGGVVRDLGSHVLDLMYYLIGEFSKLTAKTSVLYEERPDKTGKSVRISAEDAAYVIAEMKDGSVGTMEFSKIATGASDELDVEIHGDKGAIRFNLMEPNWLEFFDNTLPEVPLGGSRGYTKIDCVQRYPSPGGTFPSPKSPIGWMRGHVHCLYNFLMCVHEGRQAAPSFKDGAYIQHIMDKIHESAASGRWIDV